MFLGINLSKDDEGNDDEVSHTSNAKEIAAEKSEFSHHIKLSVSQVKQALSMPEIYMTLLFFLLSAVSDPQYGIYWYYF